MLLTKTKFMIGLECPRCFWRAMHDDHAEELSQQEEQRINQGIQLGNLAKGLFPISIDLSSLDIKSNIEYTLNSLQYNKVIFEAGFCAGNLYARIDMLVPNGDGSWDIVEVKSGTKVEDRHIYDITFQKYVCSEAGVLIKDCYLMHLNNSYVKAADIKIEELYTKEKVSIMIDSAFNQIPMLIYKLTEIMDLPSEPEIKPEKYLLKEYPCELGSECWAFLPEHNVSTLYRMNKNKAVQLFRNGIFEITEVPESMLSAKQLIQKKAVVENKAYINKGGIRKFVNRLQYPLYYFDFETFSEPIPRFNGTKAYQQMPFQYSLHVEFEDGTIEHYEFLHREKTDPRKEILNSMKKVLGNKGSIIVFNEAFEKARLKELAEAFPQYEGWVEGVLCRIVDLINPFRNFDYYSPEQKGSCSIKKVLPAITGYSYEELEIDNGGDASLLYFLATHGKSFSCEEKKAIYDNLLKYCGMDTEGMVWIVRELRKAAM